MSPHHWRVRLVGVDLSDEARAIIDDLIAENDRLRDQLEDLRLEKATTRAAPPPTGRGPGVETPSRSSALDTRQFPDTRMLITASAEGQIKRTDLNSYYRQRRGGLG